MLVTTCTFFYPSSGGTISPKLRPSGKSGPERMRRDESACEVFNARELEYQSCKISWAADGENELRAKRETHRVELSSWMRWVPIQPSSIGTVTEPRVTMGERFNSSIDGGDTVEMSRER